jgi:acyl carrier protein
MKTMDHILVALQKINIDVENLNENQTFGRDIGMDSQEMVEFYFTLEKNLNVTLPEGFFNKNMSIKEAKIKLEEHMTANA